MKLDNAEDRHKENPDTFWIPSLEDRQSCKPGDNVKLMIEFAEGTERLWIEIDFYNEDTKTYQGRLNNRPALTKEIKLFDIVKFKPENIINIFEP